MIIVSGSKIMLSSKEELEDYSVMEKSSSGEEVWKDADGLPHREDGPAVTSKNGDYRYWNHHGKLHRTDGPALETPTATGWLQNGKYHREDGPAYISGTCQLYYLNGQLVAESDVRALGKMK
jgi:hypothetical protein